MSVFILLAKKRRNRLANNTGFERICLDPFRGNWLSPLTKMSPLLEADTIIPGINTSPIAEQ